MRLDSNSVTTAEHATTPQRSGDTHQNDLTRAIDFPPAPDDVRLHRQTGRRICPAGGSTLLTGLAVTILGIAGVAGGAYFVIDAATTVDDSSLAQSQASTKYRTGGALLGLGVLVATLGFYRLGIGWGEHREMASEPQDLHVEDRLEMKVRAREYA